MNAVTELCVDTLACASDLTATPQRFSLRRSGRKPVRFSGAKILETAATPDAAPLHYDLAIYKTDTNRLVLELVTRRGGVAAQDVTRVECFDTLDDLAHFLQSYCCAEDVPVPPGLANQDVPLAVAALHAVRLRDTIARIEDEYRALLSDVFEVLGIGEEPTPSAKPSCGHGE